MISKNTAKLIRSLESRKHRLRTGLFVAEGPKAVESLAAARSPEYVAATAEWLAANPALAASAARCDEVTADGLRRVSFMQHPQQVLALFPLPRTGFSPEACADGLVIALDRVQDPGNLGTIIRLADWFGISTVICGEGTADAYSPKAVQATMGSLARVAVVEAALPQTLAALPKGTPVYATALGGADIYVSPLEPRGVIVMGNEGTGVSPEVMRLAGHTLLIPSYGAPGGPDSLNVAVATAVVCAEFRRRQRQ